MEFPRGDAVVGAAICADLQRAVRHIRDEKVFCTQYGATSARAFAVDKNMLVYRYADTSSEVEGVIVDHGGAPAVEASGQAGRIAERRKR